MYNKAQEMLQKARQPKHGDSKTILERWHKDDDYHKSLSDIGWTEEQILQYDKNCTGRPLRNCNATPKERARNEKNWVLSLNKEGVQGPLNQRPDFVESKRLAR